MSLKPKDLANRLTDEGWPRELTPAVLEDVLREALQRGGDLAELYFEDTGSTRVVREGGKVDRIVDGVDRGVGLRILFDRRSVYGYTTDLTREALLALAHTLRAAVENASPRTLERFEWRESRQLDSAIAQYQVVKSPRAWRLEQRLAILERTEKGVREELPDARQITVTLLDSRRRTLIVNSDALFASTDKTYLTLAVQAVAQRGERIETAYEGIGGWVGTEFFEESPPEALGREVGARAKRLLDAHPAPSGALPVVLAAEAGGTMIHEAVGHGLEADLACNGLSVYQGKIGQKVASPLITVLDDGTLPGKRGSYVFDDEGTPSKKTTLIENGVLKGYLVDRLSAMKFDLMATGNGRRETFRNKPIVRMTNTYIAPGKDDPAQILRDTPQGVYVKKMGGGQVNTVTGDFVFAVTEGYLIRDGKLAEPIRGATLVGNGPQVLAAVDRVGSDLGFAMGTCGKDGQGAPVTDAQPTLRIPSLTVGGEVPAAQYFGA
jgi:TldD protein